MSSSSITALQPNRPAPQAPVRRAPKSLIGLIWACAAVALLLAIVAPLGFAPMSGWGDEWRHEFHENNTAGVISCLSILAGAASAGFALAALLAMRRLSARSILWMRHLLIGGYVLAGVYLFTGVRIINLVWEKKLTLELPALVPQSPPTEVFKILSKPEPAIPTAVPTTQKAAVPNTEAPVVVAPASPAAKPNLPPAPAGVKPSGPTMRTDGIDLDAPASKPPPLPEDKPAPKPAPPAPGIKPAIPGAPSILGNKPPSPAGPSIPDLAVTPSSANTQPAATQPARSTVNDALPTPPDLVAPASVIDDQPVIIANQYLLYLRTLGNRIGVAGVALFIVLVVLTHVLACDFSRWSALEARHASSGSQDAAYHTNLDTSIVVHVLVILIIPLLLQLHRPNRWDPLDFSMPGGGGGGEPVEVRIVKRKPHKKVPKYVFQKNSAISFFIPKMDDSHVADSVERDTQDEYKVTGGVHGTGHGKGRGKGHGSGWGTGNGKVRFYHLHYSGDNSQWDDGFADGKDTNLLQEWQAHERKDGSDLPFGDTVVLTPSQLRPDAHGLLPPFVFITGNANAMSVHETDQVRQYLLKGGMIFADPQYNWQASFLVWAKRLFPGQNLIPIDNRQDPIFDGRYPFPGPPAFWSGNKSFLGIKHDDRWIIICDRGRMADGWKAPINEDCVRMGINIIDYAHAHMMDH